VKEKILELEHTNSVSMPSALCVEAGTELVLLALRVGSVKLRLPVLLELAVGASGVFAEAEGDDMAGVSREHCRARAVQRDSGSKYHRWRIRSYGCQNEVVCGLVEAASKSVPLRRFDVERFALRPRKTRVPTWSAHVRPRTARVDSA
jgi:hypothetical protein